MVDPSNPNAVIPTGTTAQSQNLGTFNTGTAPTSSTQPIAQAPMTPAPQPATPPAPTATPTTQINIGTPQTTTPTATTSTGQSSASGGQLAMPSNGSVVDLLNMAGEDSSQANRKALAQQYGVQGYDFSAAKNKELADKYITAFNAKKDTAAPQTEADARSQVQAQMGEMAATKQQDPEANFFDQYMSMNPVVKSLYDAINQELSTPVTTQSFKDEYAKLTAEQGIPALQMELMNMKNIMDGTEDDIRTEITKAGGFATESQVAALSGARNKVLLKQATNLQNQLALKEDYVDRLMEFSQLDRAEVEKQVDRRLNLTGKLADIQDKITSAAKDNYKNIVNAVGFGGLAKMFQGDPKAQQFAEMSLGLPFGSLSDPELFAQSSVYDKDAPSIVKEYQYAQAQGYQGSFSDYQNEDANRKRSVTNVNVGAGGLTPSQQITVASGLRDDVRVDPDVKDFIAIRDGYQRVKTGSTLNSGPGDLALIFGYMKMLDPTSVVREQEFSNAEQAVGLVQKYQNVPDRFVRGTRLTEEGRKFFVQAAEQLYNAKKTSYDSAIKFYNDTASAYGVSPTLVTRDYSAPNAALNVNSLPQDQIQYVQLPTRSTFDWGALTITK